jgi:hypothetical protein
MKENSMTAFFSKAFKALALSAIFAAAGAQALPASAATVQPAIVLPSLTGSWAATLIGNTGCGFGTMYLTFTLNTLGHSTATVQQHASGCAKNWIGPMPFTIQSLNANGSGTATLICGTNCGWNLTIQVSPDLQEFNIVDVAPGNPNNYLEGSAVRRLF